MPAESLVREPGRDRVLVALGHHQAGHLGGGEQADPLMLTR